MSDELVLRYRMATVAKAALGEAWWQCRNGHVFAKGELVTPHGCPECGTSMVRWVGG